MIKVNWANRPSMWNVNDKRDNRYCPYIAITSPFLAGSITLYLSQDGTVARCVTYSKLGRSYPQDIAYDVTVKEALSARFFAAHIRTRREHPAALCSGGIGLGDYSGVEPEPEPEPQPEPQPEIREPSRARAGFTDGIGWRRY